MFIKKKIIKKKIDPKKKFIKKKICKFKPEEIETIDFKDVNRLRYFITERGKIIPRRISGTCARHQRSLAHAISQARHIALLPFSAEAVK